MFCLFISCWPPYLLRQVTHSLNLGCIDYAEPQGPIYICLPGAGNSPGFFWIKFWVIKFRSSCLCDMCFTN